MGADNLSPKGGVFRAGRYTQKGDTFPFNYRLLFPRSILGPVQPIEVLKAKGTTNSQF